MMLFLLCRWGNFPGSVDERLYRLHPVEREGSLKCMDCIFGGQIYDLISGFIN